MTWDSVDLPEPFGPMMACTSPLFTASESPWRISRSSTRTCRFLTSSNGIHLVLKIWNLVIARSPCDEAIQFCFRLLDCFALLAMTISTDAALQRDRNQLLRFNREFHRQLLQH